MRYSKRTSTPTAEVLARAKEEFSKVGLKVTEESTNRVCLENEDGFVTVQMRSLTGDELDIITDGFDQRVKDFLKRVR